MKKLISGALAVLTAVIMALFPITAKAAVSGVWPVEPKFKTITTYFDPNRNVSDASGYHNAIDIQADGGSNIYAAYNGKVTFAGWLDGYGYTAVVWHSDLSVYTFYSHCSALKCSAGDTVSAGQIIGLVGMTGAATGNHLHFGVCDTIDNGWPRKTYFDPLSYFTYVDVDVPIPAGSDTCECSEEYAGLYTTKNVQSYLNIRVSHSANSSSLGQIPAGAQIVVSKGDGTWAHVEYNGISGYCSMAYMERLGDVEPGMSVSGLTYPEGELTKGNVFYLKGVITSTLPIAKVWGGVYNAEDESATSQVTEATPNKSTYDLSVYFDKQIGFGKLDNGAYTYLVMAEDSEGNQFEIARSSFWIGAKPEEPAAEPHDTGDINLDGSVNIADAVVLQQYLICKTDMTEEGFALADINSSGRVDVFDLILLEDMVTE